MPAIASSGAAINTSTTTIRQRLMRTPTVRGHQACGLRPVGRRPSPVAARRRPSRGTARRRRFGGRGGAELERRPRLFGQGELLAVVAFQVFRPGHVAAVDGAVVVAEGL